MPVVQSTTPALEIAKEDAQTVNLSGLSSARPNPHKVGMSIGVALSAR